jgi:hypothetical protein
MCDLKIATIELFPVIFFLSFCFIDFIAGDPLGCGLAVCYGVFTLLFATAKGARVVLAKNAFTKSFSRACPDALEATNRRGNGAS